MNNFKFDTEKLNKLAEENKDKYQGGSPCPHIYFDNFLPENVAREVLNEFPGVESNVWDKNYKDERQFKMACEDSTKFPESIREVLKEFNSSEFIKFLEKLTGIDGLIPDPHYRGGGMHQIKPGGFLKVHVDFNWYPKLKLERRLNVLLYLNENWKEEYGGHFELWDKEMKNAEVKVLPIFNRVAMFSTSEDSYHGHPDPIACPEDMTRKSLALYYYTSPANENQIRGGSGHSTLFYSRPGEKLTNKSGRLSFIKKSIKNFLKENSTKEIIRKIFWRIKFLLLDSWGKHPLVILHSVFPFILRSEKDWRIKFLEKRNLLKVDFVNKKFYAGGFSFSFENKPPIGDIISLLLNDKKFIKNNFINNRAFVIEGPYKGGGVDLSKGDVVLDVGANIGLFSIYSADKIGEEGKVYSFEPINKTSLILEKNLKENGVVSRVEIVEKALGDENKDVYFNVGGILGESHKTENTNGVLVNQVTLDSFVFGNNLEKVSFIKADIEGEERNMLMGAEKTIKKFKPKLAICIYHLEDDPEVIEKIIKGFVPEYKIYKNSKKIFAWI